MTRPEDNRKLALWLLAGLLLVGAFALAIRLLPTPRDVVVTASPHVPFVHNKSFYIVFKRVSGTWGNTANITITATLVNGASTQIWDPPTQKVRKDGNKSLGVVLTAKRFASSTPPVYGSLQTTIVDNGTEVIVPPILVTELPGFDPCP